MIRFPLIALTVAAAALLAGCKPDRFAELDRLLDSQEQIEAQFRHKADSLLDRLIAATTDEQRWACAEDLYKEWRHINLDSCRRYTAVMLKCAGKDRSRILRSQAAHVRNLVRSGRAMEADSVFSSITLPPDASPEDCAAYFYSSDRLLNYMYPRDKQALNNRVRSLSEDYMRRDSATVKARLLKIKSLRYDGRFKEAIELALSIPGEEITDIYDLSSCYMALSSLYLETGDREKALDYLIKTSCIDIGEGKKDYFSLYMLAQILFRYGDRRTAARYMNRAVQDALSYNFPAGVTRSASASAMMNDAIQRAELRQRRIMFTGIALVSLFLAVALLLLWLNARMLGRYRTSQESLRSVSLIKDRMLGEYMELSSGYIDKVDENRARYRKVLKENGPEALMKVFREPSYADAEFRSYWNNFDKIFLSIFPDFVGQVNRLMAPEHAFVTEGPGALSTELRILALVRLGITESKRIAAILHISRGTVYTYRCVMRQNSLEPEGFEERIGSIGEPTKLPISSSSEGISL